MFSDLKLLNESVPFFQSANDSGIHRALIEIGNVSLAVKEFSVAKIYFETEFGNLFNVTDTIGTPRDLSESNQLYLQALKMDGESR